VKRAGSAVELRPAPQAREAAHPQERQHSAAEGGTRDRVRPDGVLRCGGHAAPASGIVTRMGGDALGDHGRSLSAPVARLRAPRALEPARRGRTRKFAVLNTVLILKLKRRRDRKPL
jgi:hypothetical protein